MSRLLESTFIHGPAGRLEALHEAPEGDLRIERAAVICHPHPLYGGTLHSKVVFRLARAARRAQSAVLRFNFRGVGQSAGEFDEGRGEQDDLRAALGYVSERYPGLPLVVGGFSFGARIGLRVCCGDARIERMVATAAPVDRGDWSFLEHCGCQKLFLQSTNDEYASQDGVETVFAAASEPKKLAWVKAADHFFSDALDHLEEAAYEAWQEPIPAS